MEIIKPVSKKAIQKEVDEKAKKVFSYAIELVGGLRRLVEYKHLTWLPSLAEAAYSVVLKNKLMLTNLEIAEELGLSRQTVNNILAAKEEKLEAFLKGKLEKLDEHKAGSLAKLAYKKLKKQGLLEETAEVAKKQIEELDKLLNVDIAWAVFVLHAVKGLDFPVKDKAVLKKKLQGIKVKGKNISRVIDKIKFPIRSPADLLHKIKKVL